MDENHLIYKLCNAFYTVPAEAIEWVNKYKAGKRKDIPSQVNNFLAQQLELKFYEAEVVEEKIVYGHKCKRCDTWYEHATANQPDGTLICWSCRN